MYKNELDGYEVGEVIRIKGQVQPMTITHLETRLFNDNVCQLIYQLPKGKMSALSNVPIKTIRKTKCV